MDKQQAAREAIMKYPYAIMSDHTPKAFRDGFSEGVEAAQSALMPALVEARDALARASSCQFRRTYYNDKGPYLAGDDDAEYFVKEALARINLVIGDKK